MRKPIHPLLAGTAITITWGTVLTSTIAKWDDHIHDTIGYIAICITISYIALGNRATHHRDVDTLHIDVAALRTAIDSAIAASNFGQLLEKLGGVPYRPAFPGGPLRPVNLSDIDAIAGVEEGCGVIDIDAVRAAIRRSHN